MNTSSFIGQLSSMVLVGYLRVPTLMIIATFCCSVILFGMIGVHTVTGVVLFGVLYGYFAGICTSFCVLYDDGGTSAYRASRQFSRCGRPCSHCSRPISPS